MKVRVALIDSGVKSKLYNERFQTYIDEGYEIVVNREKNFLQINESNFEDYNGHGTACAFTIKELAPDISIIPIKILGNDGRGNIEQLIAALELLDELDVQVVNMSISSNIKNLEDRLEPIIRKLIKRGIVCIAAESNYRNTSIPAEMDNVIGTRGSWAIYGSKFQYCRNKSIQILGSGAPELVDSEIGFSTFFKGNSKATAIITGIIANQMCVQGGFNQNIEDFLQSKSCEEKELYSSIDFKCLNYELNKIVFNILNELEKKGQINVIIKKEGLLDFSRSNIKDFYTIIKELEKIFACKIMGKTKVYKSYFESLNNLAKLVEVLLIITGYGGYETFKGNITIGVLVVFLQYCVKFITPLENMILLKVSLNMIKPSLNRIDDIFTGSNPSDKKRTINDIEEIQLENVTFGYEEEQKVIKNADLSFKKNRKYLICGKSGIGKSTIINLILGFWNPNCGKILINGIDIKEYDIEQVRDRISIVSQKTFFLHDTIYNNLTNGNVNFEEGLIHKVLKQVEMYDDVNKLPRKMDTIIGDDGMTLSGGQRQRLAIARALLKESDVFIFDEPTSALDLKTERVIAKTIENIRNKIVIIVSHSNVFGNIVDNIYEVKKNDIIIKEGREYGD